MSNPTETLTNYLRILVPSFPIAERISKLQQYRKYAGNDLATAPRRHWAGAAISIDPGNFPSGSGTSFLMKIRNTFEQGAQS